MAYIDDNTAYDLSLFEEPQPSGQPKAKTQKNKVYDINKERRYRRWAFLNPLEALGVAGASILAVFAVAAVIYGQAQLTELNHEIANAQQKLKELSSTYTQVEMAVENKLGPSVVEDYAKNVLGMSKADNSQKEFISFSEGDKAVVANDGNKNIFQSLYDTFMEVWCSDN